MTDGPGQVGPGQVGPGHDGPGHDGRSGSRWFAVIVPACVATLTVLGMIALWPGALPSIGPFEPAQRVTGVVLAVDAQPCPGETSLETAPGAPRCGTVTVELSDGPEPGARVSAPIPVGPGAPVVKPGDRVVLVHTPGDVGLEYQVVDHQRGLPLWLVVIAAALIVIAFGRWRGLASLGGLAVTFTILLVFI